MLIPLKDTNPLKRIRFQYVTVALIAACAGVFLWQVSLGTEGGQRAIYQFGTIPATILGDKCLNPDIAVIAPELTLISSMFLHGDWMHIIGNMLFLWVFGDNVEDSMGHAKFLFFYLLCGVAAALAHVFTNAESAIPTIGASGAVSGVLGAYLVLHPKAQVLTLLLRIIVTLPAVVVLGLWIGLQFFNAWMTAGDATGGGVAWWAHIGGFVVGAVLIVPFRHKSVPLLDGLVSSGGGPGGGKSGGPSGGTPKPRSKVTGRSRIPPSGRRGDGD